VTDMNAMIEARQPLRCPECLGSGKDLDGNGAELCHMCNGNCYRGFVRLDRFHVGERFEGFYGDICTVFEREKGRPMVVLGPDGERSLRVPSAIGIPLGNSRQAIRDELARLGGAS